MRTLLYLIILQPLHTSELFLFGIYRGHQEDIGDTNKQKYLSD